MLWSSKPLMTGCDNFQYLCEHYHILWLNNCNHSLRFHAFVSLGFLFVTSLNGSKKILLPRYIFRRDLLGWQRTPDADSWFTTKWVTMYICSPSLSVLYIVKNVTDIPCRIAFLMHTLSTGKWCFPFAVVVFVIILNNSYHTQPAQYDQAISPSSNSNHHRYDCRRIAWIVRWQERTGMQPSPPAL